MDSTNVFGERTAAPQRCDPDQIRESLRLLHDDLPFEVRILNARGYFESGYFDDVSTATKWIIEADRTKAKAVYATVNPPLPDLLARAANRIEPRPKQTTSDHEITRRRWLFIDIDPARPAGIAATDAEVATARALAADVEDLLRDRGWPYPIHAESGNGAYLLYRIDLPNDDGATATIKSCYAALDNLLGGIDPSKPHATLDGAVYNAARILRVGGTLNRKGDPTEARPHRLCVYHPPDPDCPIEVVPAAKLRELADLAPSDGHATPSTNGQTRKSPAAGRRRDPVDIPSYLGERGIAHKVKSDRGRTIYQLADCVFDPNHGAHGESSIIQRGDGLLTYHCMHNSCQGRTWHDVTARLGKPNQRHDETGKTAAPMTGVVDEEQNEESPPPAFTKIWSTAELLKADLSVTYLVEHVLTVGEPGVIGGRSKACKTSIALDLAVSLGSATPFLNHFAVPEQVNVGIWSGESGAATIRRKMRTIAEGRGIDPRECRIAWSFALPKLARADHLVALRFLVEEHKLRVCIIDPLYLALITPELVGRSADLFAMGCFLEPITALGHELGVTFILCHHFRKSGQPNEEEPAGLEELSQSGIAEWARQWVLLQRRSAYANDGRHELFLRAGGSAGHAGLYALDIDEGAPDAWTWDATVRSIGSARDEVRRERESQRAQIVEKKDNEQVDRLRWALNQFPDGETAKRLRTTARLNPDSFDRALHALEREGRIEEIEVEKNKRKWPGYRLRNGHRTTPDHTGPNGNAVRSELPDRNQY